MKTGYLKKDQQERYNSKRGWFVNAWRIVNSEGKDMVQPWMNTKKEALSVAKECEITIKGDWGTIHKEANYD